MARRVCLTRKIQMVRVTVRRVHLARQIQMVRGVHI